MTQFRSTIAARFVGQVRAQETMTWEGWNGLAEFPAEFFDRAMSVAMNLSLARQTLRPGSRVPDMEIVRRAASFRNI